MKINYNLDIYKCHENPNSKIKFVKIIHLLCKIIRIAKTRPLWKVHVPDVLQVTRLQWAFCARTLDDYKLTRDGIDKYDFLTQK